MPRGGKREGAGRKPVPERGTVIRLDELTAWRLNRLAARAGATPRDYLRDVIDTLYESASSDDVTLIVDTPPPV